MNATSSCTRRQFLKRGARISAASSALLLAPNIFLNRTMAQTGESPSEFIRVGIIGTGGQGRSNMSTRTMIKHVVALCDVDSGRL
ncbi:MAG: hypothetical protein ACP5MD_11885, partial [Verrucomicrobiia bacterium]